MSKKVLFLNACVRENSRTLELAQHVLATLGAEVEECKLYELDLRPLDAQALQAREQASRARCFSEDYQLAKQFANAETIVLAAPYWDLMFPAVVKTYFEAVTVNGLTFEYGENGIPRGLCKAKKLIYVTTSGGPIFQSFGYDYVAALAKSFYGIEDVTCVSAQGLDIRGADVAAIMREAKAAYA